LKQTIKIKKQEAIQTEVSDNLTDVLREIVSVLEAKKCEDISILDLESVNTYLSIFVICTVKTNTQGAATGRELVRSLKKFKFKSGLANRTENSSEAGWLLIDLGPIFIHIMTSEMREYYDLDRLWGDAKPIVL
jgi:ribosome-associated protein